MTNETKQALTVTQIAEKMNVTDATVRVWINSGKLQSYKLPGSGAQAIIRIEAEAFERFLKAYRTPY